METNKKTPVAAIVFSILAALMCLRALIYKIVDLCGVFAASYYFHISFDSGKLMMLLAFAALSVFLIMKKDGVFIAAPLAIIALLNFRFFFYSFSGYESYFNWAANYSRPVFVFDCIVLIASTLMSLCFLAISGILALYCISNKYDIASIKSKSELLKKILKIATTIFIVIAIIIAVARFLTIITECGEYLLDLNIGPFVFAFWTCILSIGTCIVSIFGIKSLQAFILGKEEKNDSFAGDENSCNRYSSYISIGKHVCLLLFTFGIWQYVWIYKTTKYTNLADGKEERTPAVALLLSLFVPFYTIYWTYKTAQKIDRIAKKSSISSDIGTLCLVLAIFIPIVPPIVMQDKINQISLGMKDEPIAKVEENLTIDALKKYRELLDNGIITEEEFDAKKKQLLDL